MSATDSVCAVVRPRGVAGPHIALPLPESSSAQVMPHVRIRVGAAEPVEPSGIEPGDLTGIDERRGKRMQWADINSTLIVSVFVAELREFA
jgi:hypothetical protein